MKKLLLLLLLLTFNIFSQATQWTIIGNGSGNNDDFVADMVIDAAGNVYLCGPIFRSQTNTYDYDIVKYNSSGVLQWAKQWDRGVNGNDIPYAIALGGSGNVYVTGESYGGNANGTDWLTMKLDGSNGQILWTVFENGNATLTTPNDKARDIAVSPSGNVYVCGSFSDDAISNGGVNMGVVKYNLNGQPQWIRKYQGAWVDVAKQIRLDAAENVYFTGYSVTNNLVPPGCIYRTFKLNSAGTQQWMSVYLGYTANHYNEPFDMELDASNNVVVTGAAESQNNLFFDIVTIKYASSNGNQLWESRFNPQTALDCSPNDMTIDGSGNVYVTGYQTTPTTGKDIVALKYNGSNGATSYVYQYNYSGSGGNHDDVGNFIAVDNAGYAYFTGFVTGNVGKDIATFILNPSGSLAWVQAYFGPVSGDDYGYRVAVGPARSFVVAGSTYQGPTNKTDWFIRKWGIPTGVQQTSSEVPETFKLYDNYPNPFNPSTTIKFDLAAQSEVSLLIYDITGKIAANLTDGIEEFAPGTYEINFDASKFSSGVYFYRLNAGSFSDVKKMILTK
ncbi:MAG: T9SS type A sorting domain-containing protein [Ignavibacteria bacterium]|nr:T9SS type A sorting domain-containing protein [Ignavibacteria bacterium]